MASQAVDKCQSREGVDVALNDIEAFLSTAKEYQLPSHMEFYSQFELILTIDVKVIFLGYFHLAVRKRWGTFCLLRKKICIEQAHRFQNSQVAS